MCEFYRTNTVGRNSGDREDHSYEIPIRSNTVEEAALKAIRAMVELVKSDFDFLISEARIADGEDPDFSYEILKDGEWLVDLETGKKLEGRV